MPGRLKEFSCWVVGFQVLLLVCDCPAAPTLDYLFPAGGRQGSEFQLSAGGKMEPWPLEVSVDCRGVSFTPLEDKGKFTVTISSNSPPGPHLVRFHSQDGASAARTFVVGRAWEIEEVEPNNGATEAQPIDSLPVVVNGRLNKGGDVDSFRIHLESGRSLVAAVDSYSLGSPVDAHLHLYGPDGVRVAFAHDSNNLDPQLAFEVGRSGEYTLQLAGFAHPPQANVRFHGGEEVVYRLNLTAGPVAAYAFPAGVRRGVETSVAIQGWNLPGEDGTVSVDVLVTDLEASWTDLVSPAFSNPLALAVDDLPEELEVEPNSSVKQSQMVALPVVLNGRIDPPGDADRFRFEAAKGVAYEFLLRSGALGFRLDGVLRLEDEAGKELKRDDDSGEERDPRISWTAPSDGTYELIVEDLFARGEPGFVYRLQMGVAVPGFNATVSPQQLVLEPGRTTELTLKVDRFNQHTNQLQVRIEDLPEGVTFEAGEVPEKGGEVKVTLRAAEEIPPANDSIRVWVMETGDRPQRRSATYSLKPSDYRGPLLVNQTDQVWVTVQSGF